MSENETDAGPKDDLTPAEPEAGEASGTPQEPVPTDYRRNIWLLVIIVGGVIAAWTLAVLWKAKTPPEIEGALRPAALAPPAQPSLGQMPRALPVPVTLCRVIGTDAEMIGATPALETVGMQYRLPRLFDVTQRDPALDLDVLVTLPGRWADMNPNLVVSDLPEPRFQPAGTIQALAPEDRVVVLSYGGETRAYPVRTLLSYPGIYDRVGQVPVFVCWSRFTQTARCLVARLADHDVQWRDAGLIYHGNDVYYDAESGSLWDPFSGRALTGPATGQAVDLIPVAVWRWEEWQPAHADTPVLAAELEPVGVGEMTGGPAPDIFDPYLQSPLVPYKLKHFNPESSPLPPKAFVLGVALGGQARAYPVTELSEQDFGTLTDSVGGTTVEVHVTSPYTGYVTAEGKLLDAPVMLWFAWQEVHPEGDVYQIPAKRPLPLDASPTTGQ